MLFRECKLKVAPEAKFTSLSLHLPMEASLGLVVDDPGDTGRGEILGVFFAA